MRNSKWTCIKCGNLDYKVGEMRVAGGFWSKVFDVQASRYSAVTCEKCTYTEFYRTKSSALGSVFDFLAG
ncbi:MAG: zinc ribbon domain-containing protein [Chromatiales bacterium]|nr:zinc ribbon domain-containing protein [Chromatiales bacterium]